MTSRVCACGCGEELPEGSAKGRRWLNEQHRDRARRRNGGRSPATVIDLAGRRPSSSLSEAVRGRLVDLALVDDPLGQSALALAGIVDSGESGSSARVQAAKELRTTLATLGVLGRPVRHDPVDELRRRREERMRQVEGGPS